MLKLYQDIKESVVEEAVQLDSNDMKSYDVLHGKDRVFDCQISTNVVAASFF